MLWKNPSNNEIKSVLKKAKTIAVLGLSDNPERTSFQIAQAMQKSGYKIIPVNPRVENVLGEKSFARLSDIEEEIDIINVFRKSEHLPAIAEEAKTIKHKAFWGQQGVMHEDVPSILEGEDTIVIMDLCIKVAHAVLLKS